MSDTADRLARPTRPLDPRAVGLWALQSWLVTAAVTVVPLAGAVAAYALDAGTPALVLLSVAVVLGGASAAISLLWPQRYYERYRWDVHEEGVVVASGWLWRKVVIVPHSRIQAVDSSSGPMERRAGLATVKLRTASLQGSPEIPALDAQLARDLAADIAERAGTEDGT